MDRSHPRCEGESSGTARQFRVGIAERQGRRVRDPAVRVARARIGDDPAELVGIGRRERCGLVDRNARRQLVNPWRPRGGANGPGREAARPWLRAGFSGHHGADATPESPIDPTPCPPPAPESRPLRRIGIDTPVTRSLPARLEAYIASSALIINSSAVRPSPGKLTTPIEIDGWDSGLAGSMDMALTPRRIFSARTKAPVGSVSGRSTTYSSPP